MVKAFYKGVFSFFLRSSAKLQYCSSPHFLDYKFNSIPCSLITETNILEFLSIAPDQKGIK